MDTCKLTDSFYGPEGSDEGKRYHGYDNDTIIELVAEAVRTNFEVRREKVSRERASFVIGTQLFVVNLLENEYKLTINSPNKEIVSIWHAGGDADSYIDDVITYIDDNLEI